MNITLENELIIVSTETIIDLFKYDNGVDVVGLYLFYHKQCKLQKTNQAYSITGFTIQGLNISKKRFSEAKKVLVELGLIEDVKNRGVDGKLGKNYIKINYIRKNNTDNLKEFIQENIEEVVEEKEDYGIISYDILQNDNLSDTDKLLLCSINSLCSIKGYCSTKTEFFSNNFDINIRNTQKSLANLVKEGYISIEKVEQNKRRIHIVKDLEKSIYLKVPNKILFDKNLSSQLKITYCEVMYLSENRCTAGNKFLADKLNKGKSTISKHISKLVNLGYLDRNINIKTIIDNDDELQTIVTRELKIVAQDEIIKKKTITNAEIFELENIIKQEITSYGRVYEGGKNIKGANGRSINLGRLALRNLLTGKEFGEICANHGKTRLEFILGIIFLSEELPFWKSKIIGPESIYKHYIKVFNEGKGKIEKTSKGICSI